MRIAMKTNANLRTVRDACIYLLKGRKLYLDNNVIFYSEVNMMNYGTGFLTKVEGSRQVPCGVPREFWVRFSEMKREMTPKEVKESSYEFNVGEIKGMIDKGESVLCQVTANKNNIGKDSGTFEYVASYEEIEGTLFFRTTKDNLYPYVWRLV